MKTKTRSTGFWVFFALLAVALTALLAELSVVNGGQPVYYYMISVE